MSSTYTPYQPSDADMEYVLKKRTDKVILVLDHVVDFFNIQCCLRSADAMGIQNVWIVLNPMKMKNRDIPAAAFQGTDLWLTVRFFSSSEEVVAALRADNREIWVTTLSPIAVMLDCPDVSSGWIGDTDEYNNTMMLDNDSDDDGDNDMQDTSNDTNTGSTSTHNGIDLSSITHIPEKLAIVMGREADGVTEELIAAADKQVYLPMYGFSESYNVSVATGLVLHRLFANMPEARNERYTVEKDNNTILLSTSTDLVLSSSSSTSDSTGIVGRVRGQDCAIIPESELLARWKEDRVEIGIKLQEIKTDLIEVEDKVASVLSSEISTLRAGGCLTSSTTSTSTTSTTSTTSEGGPQKDDGLFLGHRKRKASDYTIVYDAKVEKRTNREANAIEPNRVDPKLNAISQDLRKQNIAVNQLVLESKQLSGENGSITNLIRYLHVVNIVRWKWCVFIKELDSATVEDLHTANYTCPEHFYNSESTTIQQFFTLRDSIYQIEHPDAPSFKSSCTCGSNITWESKTSFTNDVRGLYTLVQNMSMSAMATWYKNITTGELYVLLLILGLKQRVGDKWLIGTSMSRGCFHKYQTVLRREQVKRDGKDKNTVESVMKCFGSQAFNTVDITYPIHMFPKDVFELDVLQSSNIHNLCTLREFMQIFRIYGTPAFFQQGICTLLDGTSMIEPMLQGTKQDIERLFLHNTYVQSHITQVYNTLTNIHKTSHVSLDQVLSCYNTIYTDTSSSSSLSSFTPNDWFFSYLQPYIQNASSTSTTNTTNTTNTCASGIPVFQKLAKDGIRYARLYITEAGFNKLHHKDDSWVHLLDYSDIITASNNTDGSNTVDNAQQKMQKLLESWVITNSTGLVGKDTPKDWMYILISDICTNNKYIRVPSFFYSYVGFIRLLSRMMEYACAPSTVPTDYTLLQTVLAEYKTKHPEAAKVDEHIPMIEAFLSNTKYTSHDIIMIFKKMLKPYSTSTNTSTSTTTTSTTTTTTTTTTTEEQNMTDVYTDLYNLFNNQITSLCFDFVSVATHFMKVLKTSLIGAIMRYFNMARTERLEANPEAYTVLGGIMCLLTTCALQTYTTEETLVHQLDSVELQSNVLDTEAFFISVYKYALLQKDTSTNTLQLIQTPTDVKTYMMNLPKLWK